MKNLKKYVLEYLSFTYCRIWKFSHATPTKHFLCIMSLVIVRLC